MLALAAGLAVLDAQASFGRLDLRVSAAMRPALGLAIGGGEASRV